MRLAFDATTLATTALVIATIGLVAATLTYAFFTKRLVIVTDQARKEQLQPIVKSSLSFIGPVFVVLRSQNLGRGSAKDLDVTISFHPQTGAPSTRRWMEPVLLPLGYREFFLPGNTLDQIRANTEYVTIDGECKDALGARTEIHDRLQTSEILAQLEQTRMRLVQTADEHLKSISDNTGKIAGVLDQMRRDRRDNGDASRDHAQ